MNQKPKRLFIRTEDIMEFEGCSRRTASQTISDMRIFFQKTDSRFKLTFEDYATYRGVALETIKQAV